MLLKANQTFAALEAAFERLKPIFEDAGVESSDAASILHAIRLLRAREAGGVNAIMNQITTLETLVAFIEKEAAPCRLDGLEALKASLNRAPMAITIAELEERLRDCLSLLEMLTIELNAAPLPVSTRMKLLNAIVQWEAHDLEIQTPPPSDEKTHQDNSITKDALETYLRDRFNEPTLAVVSLTPLSGGFGKQTTLFSVAGKSLCGEFVMRRDLGEGLGVNNDCHAIKREYPVIRAAYERGFPAPDALWLDTEHALLPGGDFIVMRRSPGILGGNFFKASAATGSMLAPTLAGIAAKLHTLPPLTELGDLASFIRSACWSMTRADAARAYISGWYEFVQASDRFASPALISIYRWLLDNVPEREGRATLLHGDLGFHNFLFEDGNLSAVLDWEFAHIGDPAEELGYVAVTTRGAMDFKEFMDHYVAAGGDPVNDKTLHFFKVWAYARNASAANLQATLFQSGHVNDLKLTILPYQHYPAFIKGALDLIESGAGAQ